MTETKAGGHRRNDTLLAAVADLMHDLGWFWGTTQRHAYDRIDRLLGFPVLPGGDWATRPDGPARHAALLADKEAFVNHLGALPDSSRNVRERARDRISREYGPRVDECMNVWLPVYEYLVNNNLSDIRTRPPDPNAVCLLLARPETRDR